MVAVGTHKGFVQIWDAAAGKKLSMLEGHTARVGKEVEFSHVLFLAFFFLLFSLNSNSTRIDIYALLCPELPLKHCHLVIVVF